MTSRFHGACLGVLLWGASTRAFAADGPPSADVEAAVTIAHDAKREYDSGNWAGARRLFEAAEARAHSPVLLLYLARCERNLGKWLDARALYARIVNESLSPSAPEPFAAARIDARNDLESLVPRIPKLSIQEASLPQDALVDLDGVAIPRERLEVMRDVDPGPHILHARSRDQEIAHASFVAEEGMSSSVRLEPMPIASPHVQPEAPTPARRGSFLGATITGVGVLGLGAGTLTRVVAFNKVADVESRCHANHCLTSDAGEISTAKALETVSTVCFIAGGVAAVTGIALLVTLPGRDPSPGLTVHMGLSAVHVTLAF